MMGRLCLVLLLGRCRPEKLEWTKRCPLFRFSELYKNKMKQQKLWGDKKANVKFEGQENASATYPNRSQTHIYSSFLIMKK